MTFSIQFNHFLPWFPPMLSAGAEPITRWVSGRGVGADKLGDQQDLWCEGP